MRQNKTRRPGPSLGQRWANRAKREKAGTGRVVILVLVFVSLLGALTMFLVHSSEADRALQYIEGFEGRPGYDPAKIAQAKVQVENYRSLAITVGIVWLALSVSYLLLWLWAKKKPFPACLVAFILFVACLAVQIVLNPTALLSPWGVALNVICFVGLLIAVKGTWKYRKPA